MDKKTLALLLSALSGDGNTYTKEEIDDMISQLKQFEAKKVDELPITGQIPNCIYFVPKGSSGMDGCYEYMWIDGKWEFLGSTDVDLTDYWTIDETMQYIEAHKYVLPEATADTLGGIKLNKEGSLVYNDEGGLEIATITSDQIAALFAST